MGYFTWSNSITKETPITDKLFAEILTNYNVINSSHCPANYAGNYGTHYSGYHNATHSYGTGCTDKTAYDAHNGSNYYVCSRGTRYS